MLTERTYKILLVEDDINFGMVLKDYLELNDYDVTLAKDGNQGLAAFQQDRFDICILDVMMPYKDGFTLAGEIKKADERMPLIFLTAKTLKDDVLRGYSVGADDYITKPFDSEVLLHKIKAILKRRGEVGDLPAEQNHFELGRYHFDSTLRVLSIDGKEQHLTPKEAALLRLLCLHVNEVVPREIALRKIWKEDTYFTARSMDVFITKLRKYIKDDPQVEIVNIHGNGFRLVIYDEPRPKAVVPESVEAR